MQRATLRNHQFYYGSPVHAASKAFFLRCVRNWWNSTVHLLQNHNWYFFFSYSKKERKKSIKAEQAEKRKNKIKKHVKKRKEKVSSTKKKWNIAKQLIIFSRNLSTHITELSLLFVIDWKIDSFLDLQSSFLNINDSNQVYISSEAFPSLSWPLSSRMH